MHASYHSVPTPTLGQASLRNPRLLIHTLLSIFLLDCRCSPMHLSVESSVQSRATRMFFGVWIVWVILWCRSCVHKGNKSSPFSPNVQKPFVFDRTHSWIGLLGLQNVLVCLVQDRNQNYFRPGLPCIYFRSCVKSLNWISLGWLFHVMHLHFH